MDYDYWKTDVPNDIEDDEGEADACDLFEEGT